MKISKKQFKAALNVAHEAGFNSGFECTDAPWVKHNFGNSDDPHNRHVAELIVQAIDQQFQDRDKVVKRIVKHEVKHAKARKHWNVAADYVVNLDLEKEQDDEG